uniref:Uncharacterized protein n=1 Tax=Arundo donax TaxID=35708 RepID=A0A0A9BJM4_ARUDO
MTLTGLLNKPTSLVVYVLYRRRHTRNL